MDVWTDLITDLGFPVVVAAFVLFRVEPTLKKMNESLAILTTLIEKDKEISDKDVVNIKKKLGKE